ncbi:MAG: adenylyltransferase/cytidyltransferase family protein [Clostridia bacterium]|nr:adenylyltransferase/cytidyltransferase family protein [Clostridia bacterium]
MSIPNPEVFHELLRNINRARTDDEIQAMIVSLKSEFENLENANIAFVEERVKSPMSALKKYSSKGSYQKAWNNMKDIIGLMVVVSDNSEVDKVIEYIVEHYSDYKNPNSERLYQDFRKSSVRKTRVQEESFSPQDPTGRPYQTNDGYKNVRANLMINGFPIEIQIKTREQYAAHFATHDPTYKSPLLNDDEQIFMSDKLFPYFEALAYLWLNEANLSPEEAEKVREDAHEIRTRNMKHFQTHPKVFNDARIIFGVYTYILLHREEIISDAIKSGTALSMPMIATELERVFKHTQKDLMRQNPSLTHITSIPSTLDRLVHMPYNEFRQITQSIAGEYRMEACSVTGVFDGISVSLVNTIERLAQNYREIHIGVLDNDLSQAYLGRPTVYDQKARMEIIENIKGVTSVYGVSSAESKPQVTLPDEMEIGAIIKKPYDYALVGGVFDFHPGHAEHLKEIALSSEHVIALIKTDRYSQVYKGKTPVYNQEERAAIIGAQKGVDAVYFTEYDIKPPKEVLNIVDNALEENKSVAIYMGSDWEQHLDQKPQSSLEELKFLKEHYPNVILTTTDRPEGSYSSTTLRSDLITLHESGDNNPYEITNLGESLV